MSNHPGRNDRCPCGSGKKYKNCCLETKPSKAPESDWETSVQEAATQSLEFDSVKLESSISRLRELLSMPGLTGPQKLHGLTSYAMALQHHGEFDLALEQLERIDPSWIPAGDKFAKLNVDFRKASSLAHLGKYREAAACADTVANDLDALPLEVQASILLELSRVYLLCRDFQSAEKACQRTMDLADGKANLLEVFARAMTNLGSIKLQSHNEQAEAEGVALTERSIQLKADCGDLQGISTAYNNLALYYGRIQRYERAIAFFRRDLKLSREVGDLHGLAQTLLHIADLYSHLQQPNPALKLLHEANEIIARLHNGPLKQSGEQLSRAIDLRRQTAIKNGEKLGPAAQCKCGSGRIYADCCGKADIEPISLPWDLNSHSEATEQAYEEIRALGITPTRLDFFFRSAIKINDRKAWFRVEGHDGWAEVFELPDVANIQLRSARLSLAASTADPESVEHPLAAVILAVCATEAFINQVAFFIGEVSKTDKLILGPLPPLLPGDPLKFQRETELTLKWELLGQNLCGSHWPPSGTLLSDFKMLVQLRNEFVHFKLTAYERIIPPAKDIPLVIRSLPKQIEFRTTQHSWPFRVLTASTAEWAINVASELIDGFRKGYLAQRTTPPSSGN